MSDVLLSDNAVESIGLEKCLGLTTSANSTLSITPSGCIVYAAGCVAVLLDPELGQQKRFFKISSTISALNVSPDGRYVAIGGRGSEASVSVFDIASGERIVDLKGHQYGISCLCFSSDSTVLSSCGYKLDKQLIVWNWLNGQHCVNKLGNRVNSVCFSSFGDYFVTCGERHLKWWYYSRTDSGDILELKGHPASILEAQRFSVFTDCCFGTGALRHTLFCSTSSGGICIFQENRVMDRYVQTPCPFASCIMISANMLYIGCSDGLCHIYSVADTILVGKLPLPDQIPRGEIIRASKPSEERPSGYPACYALRSIPNSRNIAVVYGDRTMIIWDSSDSKRITRSRTIIGHRACIWDIHFLVPPSSTARNESTDQVFPPNTFVTCSADSSIRFWNIDPKLQRKSRLKTPFCRDLLKVIDCDNGDRVAEGAQSDIQLFNVCRDVPDLEHPFRIQTTSSPRAIAIHPNGLELVCGDRLGRIKLFDIRELDCVKKTIQAHNSEVLTLNYSPFIPTHTVSFNSSDDSLFCVFLASGSRDNLVHIFDASSYDKEETYPLITTLQLHTSPVTITKFTPDGQKLITCSNSDNTMVFSRVSVDGEVKSISKVKSVPTPHGSVNGLTIDAASKYVITSGQDKRLNIWSVSSGKQMRSYHLEHAAAELYKSDIDPSGMFIATCSLDKKIRIFDFFSGESIVEVSGHAEAITGLKFSPDGRFLVSIGGDGCILVWKVPHTLVAAMQDRLLEMYTAAQKRLKVSKDSDKSNVSSGKSEPVRDLQQHRPVIAVASAVQNTSSSLPVPAPPQPASVSNAPKVQNRWASRIKEQEGDEYELFGQKIAVNKSEGDSKLKNKFTLELTSPDFVDHISSNNGEAFVSPVSPGNALAKQFENEDGVRMTSDDGYLTLNVGEKTPPRPEKGIGKQILLNTPTHGIESSQVNLSSKSVNSQISANLKDYDRDLSRDKLSNLSHQSAVDIEDLLEQQVDDPSSKLSEGTNLSASLSAAYFSNLKLEEIVERTSDLNESEVIAEEDDRDVDFSVVGSYRNVNKIKLSEDSPSRNDSRRQNIEVRRKETVSAVERMRERLSAMGIINSVGSTDYGSISARSAKSPTQSLSEEFVPEKVSELLSSNDVFFPPPPPDDDNMKSMDIVKSGPVPDLDEDDDTASTASTRSSVHLNEEFKSDSRAERDLIEKNKECSEILLELQRISQRASKAFDELQNMRSSISLRNSAESSHRSSVIRPEGLDISIVGVTSLPNPSDSPTKKYSSSNREKLDTSSGVIESSILFEIDKSIAQYKKCCSTLAESITAFSDSSC